MRLRTGHRHGQLRWEVHGRLQPAQGVREEAGEGGGERLSRSGEEEAAAAAEEERHRGRQRRAALRGEQTEASGERAGAGQDAQRQHGLHRAADSDSHRARRQEALQDRDAAPGLQLHLPPGQRAAAGGGLPGRAALPPLPGHDPARLPGARLPGAQRPLSAANLHFLPQQPEETGQRWWEALIFCVKQSDSRQIRSPPRCLLFKLC